MYSEQDIIDALQEAKDEVGRSPTVLEYDELDISPSSAYICRHMGWSEAKRRAGVGSLKRGPNIQEVPDEINKTQEEWENLSAQWRSHLRLRLRLSKEKVEAGCSECGYNEHPKALDYHHVEDNKVESISQMLATGHSIDDIEKEIEKCIVLCSNCHRAETDDTFDMETFNTDTPQ